MSKLEEDLKHSIENTLRKTVDDTVGTIADELVKLFLVEMDKCCDDCEYKKLGRLLL